MKSLDKIRARLSAATPLPYKKFPIFFIQTDGEGNESEQAKLMNEYMQLGMDLRFDCDRLIRAVEAFEEMCDVMHPDWREAPLGKNIEKILSGGGES